MRRRPDSLLTNGAALLISSTFLLILHVLAVALANTPTDSSASDSTALLAFKTRISADPSHVLQSWNSADPSPCNWIGITCNSASRVVSLDLKLKNFSGTIAPQLGNLRFLTHLNLSVNNLSGEIPPELGQLSLLTHLDFKQNQLRGPIPPALGNCRTLLWLDLSHNQLNGTIPSSLGNLTNLYMLQLHDISNLTGFIPPELGNLTHLTYLYLGSNSLVGSIPPELGRLANLNELYLILNKLDGTIPVELGQLQNLETLALFLNSFSGRIPPELGNLTNLKRLYLFSCNLEGSIPPELGGLGSLQELYLYGNTLTGMIPQELGRLQNLLYLVIFENQLHGGLPAELGEIKSLRNLHVAHNSLEGHIPSSLGKLSNLIYIDLSYNRFSGTLPPALANCTRLQFIKLANNSFSGDVPSEYGSLQLHTFSLAANGFTGNLPTFVHGNNNSLVVLDLLRNHFIGTLPDSWAHLNNLRILSLGYNKLQGILPSWLWRLNQLQLLSFSNNNFSGTIPEQIGQMNGLKHVGDNGTGKDVLWSDDVSIQSKGTEQVYVKISVVTSLDLSGNSIDGNIPEEIGSLNGLFNLNLSHNMLRGPIPTNLGDVLTLESLDFSNNLLTGQIPPQLTDLTSLGYLDLSYNHLTGSIPQGNQFNSFSNNSYVGNANLCGPPLSLSCNTIDLRPTSANNNRNRTIEVIIAASLASGVALGIIIAVFAYYASRIRKHHANIEEPTVQVFGKRLNLTAEELFRATDGYSDDNVIGSGGFSIVYKGVLKDGTVVAIKTMKCLGNAETEKSFVSECETLGKVRHRNLVKILGAYSTVNFKALILEFIPNGSLDMHLYNANACYLNWERRLEIACGVAQAMAYLHGDSGFGQILHCDLKPSNILLDEDFEPRISDFGIAKLTTSSGDASTTASVFRGSFGYVAPEYAYGGKVTDKGDVYSFGVVLLEMLTKRRPTSQFFADESLSLPEWVRSTSAESFMELIDPALLYDARGEKHQEIRSVLTLALSCTRALPKDRPTMREALEVLMLLKQGKPHQTGNLLDAIDVSAGDDVPRLPVRHLFSSASSSVFGIDHESSSDPFLVH